MSVRIRIKNAITDDTMDTAGTPNENFPILKLVKTPLSHQRIYIERKKRVQNYDSIYGSCKKSKHEKEKANCYAMRIAADKHFLS